MPCTLLMPILLSRRLRPDTPRPGKIPPLKPQDDAVHHVLPLPIELRYQIYGYLTPVNGRAKEFRGILAASKATRRECQNEIAQVLGRMFNKINEGLTEKHHPLTQIRIPKSLWAVTTLTVELSGCIFPFPTAKYRVGKAVFLGSDILDLLQLHLRELTIQLRDFPTIWREAHDPGWAACELLHDLDLWVNGPASSGAVASMVRHFDRELAFPGPLQPIVPVRTRSLIILWRHPSISEDLAARRHEHYISCPYTREFMQKESAKRKTGQYGVSNFSLDISGKIKLTWPLLS